MYSALQNLSIGIPNYQSWVIVFLICNLLAIDTLQATHIQAAEITYRRVFDDALTYQFTLVGFTDVGSPVVFGDGLFNFGDGREVQLDLFADSFERGVFVGAEQRSEIYTVKITHTYTSPGAYIISYREPNRNDEIININKGNSVQTQFYIQSMLILDESVGINNSPVLHSMPIDRGFVGVAFTHNPWALDPDGDSLSFRLVFPLQDEMQQVPNYELPNDRDFYVDFASGNEDNSGPATFELNPITGDLIWDAPGELLSNSQGEFSEYSLAFIIEEWRNVDGRWLRIGYVTRDMQVIVNQGAANRPNIQIPATIDLSEVEVIDETAEFTDPDQRQILPEFFGTVFNLTNEPMMVSPEISAFTSSPVSLNFQWQFQPEQLTDRPYLIYLRATTDLDQSNEFAVVTYKTWILSNGELRTVQAPAIAMPPRAALITSLEEFNPVRTLKLFPNPVEVRLYWETADGVDRIESIRIINLLTQQTDFPQVSSYTLNSFPVDDLSSGVYLLNLRTAKMSYWGKFIKN